MSFRQEIRLNALPPLAQKEILQLLLDKLELRIMLKREWIGAVPSYELESTKAPSPILKAKAPSKR